MFGIDFVGYKLSINFKKNIMRFVIKYDERKNKISERPSFPGLTSCYKMAKTHFGYAILGTERKVFKNGHRDYVWDIEIFHNGIVINKINDIDGLEISSVIEKEMEKL